MTVELFTTPGEKYNGSSNSNSNKSQGVHQVDPTLWLEKSYLLRRLGHLEMQFPFAASGGQRCFISESIHAFLQLALSL